MAIRDLTSERLFVTDDLSAGAAIALSPDQAHYLLNVLRLGPGAKLLVFNGRDGEWSAAISEARKRSVTLAAIAQVRPQDEGPDIDYLFAPLKHARLDYMVQKATEMGVSRLSPVITDRTIAGRVNIERMAANATEAAEQCGILRVPEVRAPEKLQDVLDAWLDTGERKRPLVFCDEGEGASDPIRRLETLKGRPVSLLIGPEGGFSDRERERLLRLEFVVPLSLGPRIMRADTAAVAALALINAVTGDWRAG